MSELRLHNGDCFRFLSKMSSESVDAIVTDPPYGMAYQSGRRTASPTFAKIANDDGLGWLDGWVDDAHRVLKNNTAAFVFCSWHNVDTFKVSLARRFTVKNILVWVKNNHGSGDLTGAYAPKHEFIIFAHKGRCLLRAGRRPDVLFFDKVPGGKMKHPTEKPVDLCRALVADVTDPGAVVLDPFMGGGSTGVACVTTGRGFIGVELDPGYFDVSERRILDAVEESLAA